MLRRFETLISRWVTPPSSGIHWDLLDGLRGVAVLLVVACHGFYYNPHGPRWMIHAGHVIGSGAMGVQIFFVLSGFLISYPFFQCREPSNSWYPAGYATRRLLKIFPPFYLVIAILAVYYHLHYCDSGYYWTGLQWAVGIAHFNDPPRYFNTSFWSIWVELGFYVLLPVLFFFLRRAGRHTVRWVIFSILLLGSLVTRAVVWQDDASPQREQFLVSRFPGALDNFAWGVLFASFYIDKARYGTGSKRLAILGYAGLGALVSSLFVLGFLSERNQTNADRVVFELGRALPGVSTVLILFFLFDADCWGCRLLSRPALRYIGLVSYEWFLLHQPAQFQFREWLGSNTGNLLRYGLTVLTPTVFTFLLAAVIYHRFSLPIMRRGRARLRPAAPKPAPMPLMSAP